MQLLLSSVIAGAAMGNINTIQKVYDMVKTNHTDLIDAMRRRQGIAPSRTHARNLATLNFHIRNLQGYGCWCYFDDTHGDGKGLPVDVFDEACQSFHYGITCAAMDHDGCDANQQEYNVRIKSDFENPAEAYDCVSVNDNKCAEVTCHLETQFVNLLMEQNLERDNPRIPEYDTFLSSNGFQHDSCRLAGKGRGDRRCCGKYDCNTRRPISFLTGENKQCCTTDEHGNFKTYNADIFVCCSDTGEIKLPGQC